MKFKGNVKMTVERLNFYDEFGQATTSLIFNTLCSVVKLETLTEKTPSRMSQSASMGNSEESMSASILLVGMDVDLRLGDRITVSGISLRADKKFMRYTTGGKPNHFQIECSTWA
jgi:hypothetical protein